VAHTFLNPAQVAAVANELVRGDLVLGSLVGRNVEANFSHGTGASVNIRKPAVLSANTRAVGSTAAITTGTLTETYQSIQITEQAYNAVDLTDADLTLNLADFGRQVLQPQSIAIGEYIEEALVSKLATVTASTTMGTYAAATPQKTFTAIRKALRQMRVPASGLSAVVGTSIYADILDSGILDGDKGGDSDALRNANVGNMRGFHIVESNRVDDDDIFVFHRDAVQLVMATPTPPRGATYAAQANVDGYGLSWIMDYDATTLQDRSVLSVFLGVGFVTIRQAKGGADVLPIIRVNTAGD
jgi:hypothetical protein